MTYGAVEIHHVEQVQTNRNFDFTNLDIASCSSCQLLEGPELASKSIDSDRLRVYDERLEEGVCIEPTSDKINEVWILDRSRCQ